MDNASTDSTGAAYVCTSDVAAFVDALETINCSEVDVWVFNVLSLLK